MATPGKKKSSRIVVLLVLIIILVIVLVGYLALKNRSTTQTQTAQPTAIPASEMVNIVITTQSIAMGVPFTQEVLTTIPYPKAQLVEGTFYTDINEVLGKRARYNLDARIPITKSMIVDQPTGSMASFLIPPGMTAYSIPIDANTSISYAPQIGDHVMIVGCISLVEIDQEFQSRLPNFTSVVTMPGASQNGPATITSGIATSGQASSQGRVEIDPNLNQAIYVVPSENQRPRIVCQTVVQDSTVLHVGQFEIAGTTVPTTQEQATQQNQEYQPVVALPDHITLILSPQDVVTLKYLEESNAILTLALRSAGDLQPINTQSVTLQFVMEQKNIQIPAQLPYGIYPTIRDQLLEAKQ
jgi:Flp pilus assembly protein CpaB